MTRPLPSLARILSTHKGRTPVPQVPPSAYELGTVTVINADGTVDVTFDGNVANAVTIQALSSFIPIVGQTVFIGVMGTVPYAIGAVADGTTDWINVADDVGYASGWSDSSGGIGSYRIIGDMVQLRGQPQYNTTISTDVTMFTLPTGYAPQGLIRQAGVIELSTGQPGPSRVRVDTSGNVIIQNISGSTSGSTPWASLDGVAFSLN